MAKEKEILKELLKENDIKSILKLFSKKDAYIGLKINKEIKNLLVKKAKKEGHKNLTSFINEVLIRELAETFKKHSKR